MLTPEQRQSLANQGYLPAKDLTPEQKAAAWAYSREVSQRREKEHFNLFMSVTHLRIDPAAGVFSFDVPKLPTQ